MEWKIVKLGEIVNLRQGFAINKKTNHHISKVPTNLHLLRIADMKEQKWNIFVKDTIPQHFIAKPEDIIYSRTGVVGLVFRNQIGVIHNNCFSVSPIDVNKLNRDFLFYLLQTPDVTNKSNLLASGVAQPDLPHSAFKSIEVNIPDDYNYQHRIASILSAYDDQIENHRKQIKLLEEAANRIYKHWFVDFKFPNYKNTKFVDGLPEGWKRKKIGEVFTFVRGKSYTSDELSDKDGVLMVNLKNIRPYGGYKYNEEKRFIGKFKDNQILKQGDVVMGVTDMTQDRRLVGHVALIPNLNETTTFSMDLIKLEPFEISNYFLYCSIQYTNLCEKIAQIANGTNVLHLKPELMQNIEIIIPNNEVRQKFDLYYNNHYLQILNLQTQLTKLQTARDLLLPKLMNGEIELSVESE